MGYKLILDDKATCEIQDSYQYYELISKELSNRFFKTVWNYLEKIQNNPFLFSSINDSIREAYIKKFPFVIVYEIVDKTIIVYSVFHTSRNPGKKLKD